MRVFQDQDGRSWQAVVGRESWGAFVAIFLPERGGDPPRQTALKVRSMEEALKSLAGMENEELCSLLAESTLKPLG